MDQDIPITNDGANVRYVAGIAIPPGETRIVPSHLVPKHLHPGAQAEASTPPADDLDDEVPGQALLDLLQKNVATVADATTQLTMEELDELEALEQQTQAPRKGVLDAITKARLHQARRQAEVRAEAEIAQGLAADGDLEALDLLVEGHAADADVLTAVLAAIRAVADERLAAIEQRIAGLLAGPAPGDGSALGGA